MISAIVYTSKTGNTKKYAQLLSDLIGLPAYSANAVPPPKKGREVIYLGWIFAGGVKGLKSVSRKHKIRAVCPVGMGPATEKVAKKVRRRHHLRKNVPVFPLQGGYDLKKLHGVNHVLMSVMEKKIMARLKGQEKLSPAEMDTKRMIEQGYSVVSSDRLTEVVSWYKKQKR